MIKLHTDIIDSRHYTTANSYFSNVQSPPLIDTQSKLSQRFIYLIKRLWEPCRKSIKSLALSVLIYLPWPVLIMCDVNLTGLTGLTGSKKIVNVLFLAINVTVLLINNNINLCSGLCLCGCWMTECIL